MPAPTYASAEDFADYIGTEAPEENSPELAAMERVLLLAERQLDAVVTYAGPRDLDAMRRIAPDDLDAWDKEALKNATCAQAAYIAQLGEDHFRGAQYPSVDGPDFKTVGTMPTIAPAVWDELANAPAIFRPSGVGFSGSTPPDPWE